MTSNKYGLQIPKKNLHGLVQKHAAFGDDSDSDKSGGDSTDWTKKALKASEKTAMKRQSKMDLQRALTEDSTVYQYDEVYDELQKTKQDSKQKDKERKPKYILKLKAAAEKRKIENERRIERQVQKERDAEGEEFKDKETFVTSAYKKKLEEFAKLDAEQMRLDMLEEIGDVTKQQDMGGFYRHLYQSTVSSPMEEGSSVKEKSASPKKESTSNRNSNSKSYNGSKENSPSKISKDDSSKNVIIEKENGDSKKKVEPKKDSRQYRKRKDSESSTDKHKDADTGGSSSSSTSSSSDSESGEEKSTHSETEDPKRIRSKEYISNAQVVPTEVVPVIESGKIQSTVEPEISIWEKRTVGPVFDAALKRYLERKNARLLALS